MSVLYIRLSFYSAVIFCAVLYSFKKQRRRFSKNEPYSFEMFFCLAALFSAPHNL
jgi:hypothetical protein